MSRSALFRLLPRGLAAGLFVLLSAPVAAATLEGRIVTSGVPVPGAHLILTATDGTQRDALTSSEGVYRIDDVEPGTYRITVHAQAFGTLRSTLRFDGSSPEDIELAIDAVATEITVTALDPEMMRPDRVSGREIERRSAEDLVEALRYQSGLSATRRGAVNLDPSVRGLQETQIATFVDGTRTFASGPARMDSGLSHIGPHMSQSVRIVKGPYALSWGSGAMSAIDVETKRPSFSAGSLELGGTLLAGYGENAASLDAAANLFGSSERFRFAVSGNQRSGDDYDDGGGAIVPGDYESSDLRGHLGFALSEAAVLAVDGGYQKQSDLDYPGRLLDSTYFYTRSYAVDLETVHAGRVSGVSAKLYSNRKDHLMNNDGKPTALAVPGRVPPFALDVDLPAESNTAGGRLAVTAESGAIAWKLGGDFYRIDQFAERTVARRSDGFVLFRDIVWPSAELRNVGVYGQGVHRGQRSQIAATVRLDSFEAQAGPVSDYFREHTSGPLATDETAISVAVSGERELGEWVVRGGMGRAVRPPTALELYSDRFPATRFQIAAEFMGNPRLDAETSFEIDLGVARQASSGPNVSLDVFWRSIDDFVTVVNDPSLVRRLPLSPLVVYRYINGTKATFLGGELVLDQGVGEHLTWRASLTWLEADDETFEEPALGIAPLTTVLELGVHSRDRRWRGQLQARVVDAQDRVATARFEQPTPGYTTFDLRGTVRLRDGVDLWLGVDNLGDKLYSHHLNSPNPFTGRRIPEIGRQFFGGVRIDL